MHLVCLLVWSVRVCRLLVRLQSGTRIKPQAATACVHSVIIQKVCVCLSRSAAVCHKIRMLSLSYSWYVADVVSFSRI